MYTFYFSYLIDVVLLKEQQIRLIYGTNSFGKIFYLQGLRSLRVN